MIAPSQPTQKGRRTRGGRGKGPGRGRGRGGGAAGRGAGRGQHNTNNKNTNDRAVNFDNAAHKDNKPQDNTDTNPSVLGTTKDKTSTANSGVAFQVNTAPVDIELDNHHTKKKFGSSPILSNKERRNQQKKERDRIKNESLQKQKENMGNTHQDSSAATGKHPSSKKVSDASSKDMTHPSASKQNKSTSQPSSKNGSTLKNIDEHSTSNTNKGANNKKKKAVTISENVGTRDSSSKKDAPPLEEEPEKERKARLLREAREKSALAKEKKKSKKSKKHDKWVKQQEAEKSARAKSWQDKIAKEDDSINLISQLITSEVVRKNKDTGLTEDQVNDNLYASQVIADESKNANDALFGGIKCRVKVAGSERQDLNGRMGTLRYWDANEKKFCVGLDTKKAKDCEEHFLSPENVEPIGSIPRTDKNKSDMQSYHVDMTNDFLSQEGDLSCIGCQFTIDKATIASIRSAESIPVGLAAFSLEQNKKEKALRKKEAKERRQAQEEEKRMEEEDRKRRAEKRKAKKENERRKEKARQESMSKLQAAKNAKMERMMEEERERHARKHEKEEKRYLREQYEEKKKEWEEKMKKAKATYVKETIERLKKDGEESDFFREILAEFLDEYGEEWEEPSDFHRKLEEFLKSKDKDLKQDETEKRIKEAAEILGVDPDADERTITVAYRKLALKYHPDKWRADSSHGLSKEDAEAKFKIIQNAADDLMAKFDEDDDENEEGSRSSQPSYHSSQADSYDSDFEQDEEKKDEQEMEDDFDERFEYESDDDDEDKIGRHFNNCFPDMPSFDEFQNFHNMMGSRGRGSRVKVTKGMERYMSAEMRMKMEERMGMNGDDDEDFDGGISCVVS